MPQNTGQYSLKPKTVLRRELRSARNLLECDTRSQHDELIGQHLLQLISSQDTGAIACYWPFNGEPDITPVYQHLLTHGHDLALPVISRNNKHEMQFHAWRKNTNLIKNRYGIFEPSNTSPLPLSSFDLLIIPLVGYDSCGNRLGMGAGYYDRCLESVCDMPVPLRVGIAYSLQEIDRLEKNKWDIPLHGLVNEHGWFTFTS